MEKRIGHYSIISELGRGGMGVVLKAHEESLNRFVALKVLGQHLSEDESYVERFKREAQSAAALNHPNIVQIYSIDNFDGRHCFAMEYVQGSSIQQMIKNQGPMDPAAAARLILQAASGLGAAHGQGIFHRDIKPANLMVDERGLVKITDFGLALLAAGATRLTATGMFMGTPGYLSPEQCMDEDVDHRADIYSLGVTFYEMLTGATPFNADSPLALLRQIIDVEPKDVGELRPEVPEPLRVVLRKMMAKNREERYPDCAPLVADLQNWIETIGNAGADLSAVVAAAAITGNQGRPTERAAGPEAAATLQHFNTEETIRVDSAQMAGAAGPPPPPPVPPVAAPTEVYEGPDPEMVATPVDEGEASRGGANPAVGLAIAAVIVLLLLGGGGWAASHFGAIDAVKGLIAGPSNDIELTAPARVDPSAETLEVEVTDDIPTDDGLAPDEIEGLHQKSQAVSQTGTTGSEPPASPGDGSPSEVVVPEGSEARSPGTLPQAGNQKAATPTERAETRYSPPPPKTIIGTGVALISIGEPLLAGAAEDFVRQTLERQNVKVFDGMTISGVAAMVEGSADGDGSLQDLLKPHARYLVVIRADYTGDRELNYMGRYDREFQARLHLTAHDLLDGRSMGPGIHAPIGYTHLTVERKIADLLRPKFRKIAGKIQD